MSDERGERKVDALRDYSDTDWKNAWGRVTHLLDVPWEASAGKVCEEIRKLREVVEFLDAVGDGPWSMSAGVCEGKASYYVESRNIKNGTWFAGNSLAAACRAALDSRKERSDG